MSRFPKSARHPDLVATAERWRELSFDVNVEDELRLADLPSLQVVCNELSKTEDSKTEDAVEYIAPARDIVCANALKALAKGFESVDAMAICARERVNSAALVQGYGAALFFARAFCLIMGFAPANRQSRVTVDVFGHVTTQGMVGSRVQGMRLHKYARWEHSEVWDLTRRLVATVRVPDDMLETRNELRRARLGRVSRIRNSFSYDDAITWPLGDAHSDFPDTATEALSVENGDGEFTRQVVVMRCLATLCRDVVERAKLDGALHKLASRRRIKRGIAALGAG